MLFSPVPGLIILGFAYAARRVADARLRGWPVAFSASPPRAYRLCAFLITACIGLMILVLWSYIRELFADDSQARFSLLVSICAGATGFLVSLFSIRPDWNAQLWLERVTYIILMIIAGLAIVITILLVASLLFESLRFFHLVQIKDFLFGTRWNPQAALLGEETRGEDFGAIPLFIGTFLISLIALAVAFPCGLFSAIYCTTFAHARTRAIIKASLEVLAGIPTVVYGLFAALTVAPLVRDFGKFLGFHASSESALAAGLVMGVMIIPFFSSLCDDAITAVPKDLWEVGYSLGSFKHEVLCKIILPAALPGILSGALLATSRAIGETMIVVMAAGLAARSTLNPFDAVTTVTVQIAILLSGDQTFESAHTLVAFALGLSLLVTTFILNAVALLILRKSENR